MNTASLPLQVHGQTTFFENRSDSGSTRPYEEKSLSETSTELPKMFRISNDVSRFQRLVGRERDSARETIVDTIRISLSPDQSVECLLRTFISSPIPGRLDDAVDILSQIGDILTRFVREVMSLPEHPDVDEDYWYVLIRALGKTNLPLSRQIVSSLWMKSEEAVIEALGDFGDTQSIDRLEEIAAQDLSRTNRELAAEILEECKP